MRPLALLLLCTLVSACSLWQKRKMDPPKIEIQGVRVENAGWEGAKLLFAVHVANPNPYALQVDGVDYSVELGGKQVAKESIQSKLAVDAKSSTVLQLPLTVKFTDLFESLNTIFKAELITYRLKGSAKVGLFSIPFDETGKLKYEGGSLKSQEK